MKLIKKIEIFKIGDVWDATGEHNSYTLEDLKELAESYDTEVHEAPVIVGHENDRAWHKHLNSKTQLSNGWVKRLYVKEESLYCDAEVDDFVYESIKDKKLKKRSLAHYTRKAKNSPVKGKLYLRHLALLGIDPPAVKGLKDIVIYKDMEPENTQMLNEKAAEWLAFAINDEGNGFNGDIIEFRPMPAEDNNWLYNAEEERFEGVFMDDEDQLFDFVISKEGEDWVSEISMTQETQDLVEDGAEEEVEMEETETETEVEMSEDPVKVDVVPNPNEFNASEPTEEEKLKEQVRLMQEKIQMYEKEQKLAKEKEVKSFCDQMYSSNKLKEDQLAKEVLLGILNALQVGVDQLYYSEGENKVSVFDGVKKLLEALPEQKEFSDAVYARAGSTDVIKSPVKGGTKESDAEYAKIKKFMKENDIKSFAVGYREYKLQK